MEWSGGGERLGEFAARRHGGEGRECLDIGEHEGHNDQANESGSPQHGCRYRNWTHRPQAEQMKGATKLQCARCGVLWPPCFPVGDLECCVTPASADTANYRHWPTSGDSGAFQIRGSTPPFSQRSIKTVCEIQALDEVRPRARAGQLFWPKCTARISTVWPNSKHPD
jgi:hypothetical protein